MNYKIKVYRHFEKEVKKLSKRYKSLKQDLTILAAELMQNPDMGTDLGNGLHKVRMSIASKGKGKRWSKSDHSHRHSIQRRKRDWLTFHL